MSGLLPIDIDCCTDDDLQNAEVAKKMSTRRREHARSELSVITEKIGADVCVQSTRLCVVVRIM